jgi:hypothetical protein
MYAHRGFALIASAPTSRFGNALWWAAFVIGSAVLAAHLTLIELGNLPNNPISLHASPVVERYVHPLFSQNWNFFAPSPISVDVTVMARAEQCGAAGRCTLTDWVDVSDPLIEKVRADRLTSLEIVQLMLSNAAIEFQNKAAQASYTQVVVRGKKYFKPLVPHRVDIIDAVIISRTSAAAIRLMHPTTRFHRLQFGLATYVFPRFSHRGAPDRPQEASFMRTEWTDFPNDISPFAPR